jgi:phospholipase C
MTLLASAAAAVLALSAALVPSAASAASASPTLGLTFPCGYRSAPPATYRHVIWIWMENTSVDDLIGNPAAPGFNYVARSCGEAANYYALTHPSFRNYIAATSGVPWQGAPASCDPTDPECADLPFPSIYGQLESAGLQWREYVQSMPSNCDMTDSAPLYLAHHNPVTYYADAASECADWNVPLGTPMSGPLHNDLIRGTLPAFSFIIPDTAHDYNAEDGTADIAASDQWLTSWLTSIFLSRDYLSGQTAIFITFDEGNGSEVSEDCAVTLTEDCHIPTLVISPSTRPGTVSNTYFDHYSLLLTTEQLLGLPDLANQTGPVTSMAPAFNL